MCRLKFHKLNTHFPFQTVYFLGFRGLTPSSYIAYDIITSGHTDLQKVCIPYIHFHIKYTFIANTVTVQRLKQCLVQFFPIELWQSCYTDKLYSSLLSTFFNSVYIVTNFIGATTSEQRYSVCQQFVHLLHVSFLHLISLQDQLSLGDF